jgi:hypothetical protein
LKQLILHGHAAQYFPIGVRTFLKIAIGRGQYVANFQSAPGAHDDAAAARITNGIDRRKAANLAHRADTD